MANTKNLIINLVTRKSRKKGYSILYFRIKYLNSKSEISTKVNIPTSTWDRETQKVKGRDSEAVKLNRQIARQETDIVEIFEKLKYSDQPISAQKIKSIYLGNDEKCKMLLELVDYHYTKEASILSEGTLKNYRSTKLMLIEFIKKVQKRSDIDLEELNYHFIYEFEMFLRTRKPDPGQKKPGQNTIMKHLQRLEKILKLGLKLGWLKENPAEHVKYRFVRKDREFLDDLELSKFENYKSSINHLQRAADIFILMCYTGLGYSDLKSLTFQDLTRGIDGNLWIIDNRVKTNKKYTIPLLDKALEIISKYRNDENNDRESLMPLISNQKLNNHLKTIAQDLNITKNLTSYVARHTFATTVTLNNDVPIESVSKMLGHTKISTTQIYSRVLEKKVSQDMNQLRKKLSNKNSNGSKNNAI